MAKKALSLILRIATSIILLVFLFRQVDGRAILGMVRNANKGYLFFAFLIHLSVYVLCLLRWEMLLRAVKIRLSLSRVIISFSGGVFFNLFLPSSVGGDVVRSVDLAAHTKRPREVVATVLLDRISGYMGLVILTLLALLFGGSLVRDKAVLSAVAVIVAILAAILLVLFNSFFYSRINRLLHSPTAGEIREAVKDLHDELHYFKHRQAVIAKNLAFSFFIQLLSPLVFYLVALSLGVKINILYFFVFIPIIGAITMLPISIGGLGLRDASTVFFFAKAGVVKDFALAISLLNFFFIFVCGAIGGLIYVLTVHHRRIQHNPQPHLHPPHQRENNR